MPFSHPVERRRARRRRDRREVRVTAGLAVLDAADGGAGDSPPLTFLGQTADISETGISFAVPYLRVDGQYFSRGGRQMRVLLRLASEDVEMQVTPVRCAPLDEGRPEMGSLIGADIAHVAETGRGPLCDYLRDQ